MKKLVLFIFLGLFITNCRLDLDSNDNPNITSNVKFGKLLFDRKELSFSRIRASSKSLTKGIFGKYDTDDHEIVYDFGKGLKLNFFQTSNEGKQPLIVFIPPGGFLKYDKDEPLTRHLCRDFARAGFYTASISYRLITQPSLSDRTKGFNYIRGKIADAMCDVSRGIRFLQNQSDDLGFDPDKIILVGVSAGGILTLHSVFSDEDEINNKYLSSGGYAVSYQRPSVKGVIAIGGALLADHIDDSDNKRTPILMFHGKDDDIVPIGYGNPYKKYIKDYDIDTPSAILGVTIGNDEGEKVTIEGFHSYIHIPKWVFEFTINSTTPKLFGSRTIFDAAKGDIQLYEVEGGKHTFMVNKEGVLNKTYRGMREKMLTFIRNQTSL